MSRRCLKNILELDNFSGDFCPDWTEHYEQLSKSGINICGVERVVLLYPISLVGVGIYKLFFCRQSTVLVELVEIIFEGAQCAGSVKKRETDEESLKEVSNNGVKSTSQKIIVRY